MSIADYLKNKHATISSGTEVRILDVGPNSAHRVVKDRLIGLTGTVMDKEFFIGTYNYRGLVLNNGWYVGWIGLENMKYFFLEVKVEIV